MRFAVLLPAMLMAAAAPVPAKGFCVMDFGAVADGAADNTAAFQKALDAAGAAGGGVVDVPAGRYAFKGTLRIPRAVTLQGTFRVPPTDEHNVKPNLIGSILLAYAGRDDRTGPAFIELAGSMAVFAGFIVQYPEWRQEDVPPVPYPPTVRAGSTANVGVLDCCFLGAYEGIHLDGAARFLVRNACGYPSFRGLYVDRCYDIGRIENCHFWPFGLLYNPQDPYSAWVNTNGVAFEFARTDWQYVFNTFCFGYGVGYKFSKSKDGGCNGNFLGIGADCCRRAVLVEHMQPFGVSITNGEFVGRWSSRDSVTIEVSERADLGKLSLMNCAFWGPNDRCIWNRSNLVQVTAVGSNFFEWDVNGKGSPAIQIDAGKAIIQGNTFWEGELNVQVAAGATSAIISGNQAPTGLAVVNGAGNRAQIYGNEEDLRQWPPRWQRHYTLDIGSPGDKTFLHKWLRSERAREWPGQSGMKRWTSGESVLRLPVAPRKRYTLTMEVYVPGAAVDPANGLYVNGRKIADVPGREGLAQITATVPPQRGRMIEVTIRTKTWNPSDRGPVFAAPLGIAVRCVTMKAGDTGGDPCHANTGKMPEKDKEE